MLNNRVKYFNLFKNVWIKTARGKAAGPSGLDADFWRRAIGSKIFGKASDDLCHAIDVTHGKTTL